jgi:hypothetical protein
LHDLSSWPILLAIVNESITSKGKSGSPINPQSLRQKALKAGLPYRLVWHRINKLGWTAKRALSTPKQKQGAWQQSQSKLQLEADEKAGRLDWQVKAKQTPTP